MLLSKHKSEKELLLMPNLTHNINKHFLKESLKVIVNKKTRIVLSSFTVEKSTFYCFLVDKLCNDNTVYKLLLQY